MLGAVLAVMAAVLAAVVSYGVLETAARPGPSAVALRATAWGVLALLLVNPGCAVPDQGPPLVLLDASLSMTSRWTEADSLARSLGEVQPFGGVRAPGDSLPTAGRSRLSPALAAAAVSDRPVHVVTDGELDDLADLSPDLLARATVHVLPRDSVPGGAIWAVNGSERVVEGDTLRLEVEVRVAGVSRPRTVPVVVRADSAVILRGTIEVGPGGIGRGTLTGPTRLVAGTHVLAVALAEPVDPESRDDTRLHLLTVLATPGIVLLAEEPGWESRFLMRALQDVSALPTRGFVQITPGVWRRMEDLQPVPLRGVQAAASGADLLVTVGPAPSGPRRSATRQALWQWHTGGRDGEGEMLTGDWYVSAALPSPIGAGLARMPLDSLPPAVGLWPLDGRAGAGSWTGLTVQAGRRGVVRTAMIGREEAGRRVVEVGAVGLWRWALRGEVAEQAYRTWVGSTVSWLLAAPDTARGVATPVRAVTARGRPVLFVWRDAAVPTPVPIRLTSTTGVAREDTLLFDGEGRAAVQLPPGTWRYVLGTGGGGSLAVEEWSAEWFPRSPVLESQSATVSVGGRHRTAREWPWLIALAVLAFSGEWFVRRRGGLR